MKTKVMLTLLAALFIAPATNLVCWAKPWGYTDEISVASNSYYDQAAIYGLGYSDGLDSEDLPLTFGGLNVAIYKTNGVQGWDSADGFYTIDGRATLLAGQTAIDDVYAWASSGGLPPGLSTMTFSASGGGDGGTLTIELVSVPSGITYTGPTEWTNSVNVTLPMYVASDYAAGLTGYHFELINTAVPEPSSIITLAGGMIGMAGFALRRGNVHTRRH